MACITWYGLENYLNSGNYRIRVYPSTCIHVFSYVLESINMENFTAKYINHLDKNNVVEISLKLIDEVQIQAI